jgi:hypothetical protein
MEKDEKPHVDSALISTTETKAESMEQPIEKPSVGSEIPLVEPEPEYEYITGFKLVSVIASITIVIFLIMLDMSIIVTVSECHEAGRLLTGCRLSLESPAISIPSPMLGGTAALFF